MSTKGDERDSCAVCGHSRDAHSGHTVPGRAWGPGEPEPTHCSQGDGCKRFVPLMGRLCDACHGRGTVMGGFGYLGHAPPNKPCLNCNGTGLEPQVAR